MKFARLTIGAIIVASVFPAISAEKVQAPVLDLQSLHIPQDNPIKAQRFFSSFSQLKQAAHGAVFAESTLKTNQNAVDATTDFTVNELNNSQFLLLDASHPGFLPRAGAAFNFLADNTGVAGFDGYYSYDENTFSWSVTNGQLHLSSNPKLETEYFYIFDDEIAERYGQNLADHLKAKYQAGEISSTQIEVQIEYSFDVTVTKLLVDGDKTTVNLVGTDYSKLIVPAEWDWNVEEINSEEAFDFENTWYASSSSLLADETMQTVAGTWLVDLYIDSNNGDSVDTILSERLTLNANGTVTNPHFDKSYTWSFNNGVITLVSGDTEFKITPVFQQDKAMLATVKQYKNNQLVRVFNSQMAKFDASYSQFTDNVVTKFPIVWLPGINLVEPESWDGDKPLFDYVWAHKFLDDGTFWRGINPDYDDNGNPTFILDEKWNYSIDGNDVITHFTYDYGYKFYRERHWEVISVNDDGLALVYEYSIAGYDDNNDGLFSADELNSYILPRLSSAYKLDLSLYTEAWESLPDTDRDGLNDYEEADYGTSPNNADTDNDGINDAEEVSLGLNPLSQDTDGDGFTDGFERDQGTDPKSATSKPGSTTLSFSTTELNHAKVALLGDVKEGRIQQSGVALVLNEGGTGMLGQGWLSYFSSSAMTWSVLDGQLKVDSNNETTTYNYQFYPFDEIAIKYGQDVANWLVEQVDNNIVPSDFQLEETIKTVDKSYTKNAIEGNNLEVIESITNETSIVFPADWGWNQSAPSYVSMSQALLSWQTDISGQFALMSDNDLVGKWNLSAPTEITYSPSRSGQTVNGLFATDLILGNDNAAVFDSNVYSWLLEDSTLVLTSGNNLIKITPIKQVEKQYLAFYELYNAGNLVYTYVAPLAKFDNTYIQLTDNLSTQLPYIYFAGINAHFPDQWNGDQLKIESVFGYQFRQDGTVRKGINGAIDYDTGKGIFYMGNEWTYTINGNQITMSYISADTHRVRTWEVISVDQTGRALVYESSVYGYDSNDDGVISPDEDGVYIEPRINTVELFDLSSYTETWNALPDSDIDGLNDYQESDYGTDMYNSDSDFDGILDGDEVNAGLNPLDANDALADYDNDGLTNSQEVMYGTDISNSDTDGDGVSDGDEVNFGLNPLDASDGGNGPSSLLELSDVNGDGTPDWLKFKLTGTEAQFSVVSGSSFNALSSFSASYELASIKVQLLDDRNADGISEIGLFGFSETTGRYQLYVFNGVNGQAMGTWNWPATLGEVEFVGLKDLTLDGIQEYAITGIHLGNGTKQLVVKNGATKATYKTFKWPNLWLETQIVVLTDVTADGVPEIGLYGRHQRLDKGQLFVYDGADSSTKIDVYNWNRLWENIRLFEMDDVDGEGTVDWGQFGQRKDDGRYQWVVKKGHDKRGVIRTFTWPNDLTDVSPLLVSDRTNDSVREVAIVGKDNTGKVFLRINDGRLANTRIANISWPAVWENTQVAELGDLNNDGFNEFALLGVNVNSGRHQVVIKDGQDTSEYGRITLDGTWTDMQLSSYDVNNDGKDDVIFSGVEESTLIRFINTYSGADLSLISSSVQ
ncbi:VCBS repeat-containing protein [Shewanella sp. MEBiC00475]|uniref:FG-GAP repeat domain-containing protein n=1 Tax=Shewanella sp. MEBiC00475 TaxID=2575361 RepID=UPI0010C13A1A|nr:VCBS repeat-containing protein [Shewanella sp. MEBiC00475]